MSEPIDLTPYDQPYVRRAVLDPAFMERYRARWGSLTTTTAVVEPVTSVEPVRTPELPRWQRWTVAAVIDLGTVLAVLWLVLVPTLKVLAVLLWWAVKVSATLLLWTVLGLLVVCTLGMLRPE